MYETYSGQALPTRDYRELLGSAICAFNSNNAFLIENILRNDTGDYDWHNLIDLESGKLAKAVAEKISKKYGDDIQNQFSDLIHMRNRIIHSFQITFDGEQILATKERQKDGGKQFLITREYLLEFIKRNENFSTVLHDLRGY